MADRKPSLVDAADLVARVRASYGPDGRLPTPDTSEWDIFPYEGELLVKHLADPVVPEPTRHGENGDDCHACSSSDRDYVWTDARWRLKASSQAFPTFLLEPRAHLDLGDLDEQMAAEMGVLVLRIERAIAAVPGVARVHVNRWGDGGAHLHLWFFARPLGMLQLRGSCLPDWLDLLPPMPTATAQAVTDVVVSLLD